MRRKWKKPKKKIVKKFVSNYQIKAPIVFVIGLDGEKLGVMEIADAIKIAKDDEMDLIEVNPKAEIPVVKVADLGKLKYETEKKAHKQKMQQKKIETKIVRLSVKIGSGDLEMKSKQAEKFLEKGSKIKIEVLLRGRERQHPEKAMEVITGFVDGLKEKKELHTEQNLTKQGARYTIVLTSKNK